MNLFLLMENWINVCNVMKITADLYSNIIQEDQEEIVELKVKLIDLQILSIIWHNAIIDFINYNILFKNMVLFFISCLFKNNK